MKPIYLVLLPLIFAACSGKPKFSKQQLDALAVTEKNTRPFNPNINGDSVRVKAVITLDVRNGQIMETPAKIELIPSGSEPYRAIKGTFTVSYTDSTGKEIGKYSMESPLTIRSCDDPKKAVITSMVNGQVVITVPYSAGLQHIRLADGSAKELRPVELDLKKFLLKNQQKPKQG
ncbi:MAG: hypothetical protein WDO19_15060 [Bacteroidota bacterium]